MSRGIFFYVLTSRISLFKAYSKILERKATYHFHRKISKAHNNSSCWRAGVTSFSLLIGEALPRNRFFWWLIEEDMLSFLRWSFHHFMTPTASHRALAGRSWQVLKIAAVTVSWKRILKISSLSLCRFTDFKNQPQETLSKIIYVKASALVRSVLWLLLCSLLSWISLIICFLY